ncbi:flagellar hook capping protein [Natroniella sulfidigena]|uniref:flagellar hook capping FlgD N-terminal domain-containing protein n=1 Tax=Natroniella sulfidigena TaxID=723921 RepID=UPI00200A729D|nr:flagellar hook capping FlgD N-terminal domain-containing protein [Natroniella sulfidigena]MCK8816527.1 flagellar hook capping protein [Natroniella sulfidigena]
MDALQATSGSKMQTMDNNSVKGTASDNEFGLTESMGLDQDDLGQEEFLKLLVAQLQHQDPLDPMDDKEFIAQTAQFSSLEQMQNLNSNFSQFMGYQQLSQASNFVGKEVKVVDSESGESVVGEVDRLIVDSENGEKGYQVVIEEQEYSLDSIQEVLS